MMNYCIVSLASCCTADGFMAIKNIKYIYTENDASFTKVDMVYTTTLILSMHIVMREYDMNN